MSYTAHGFMPGHKLTADDLNEMDIQIATSESRIDSHQEVIDDLDHYLRKRLSKLYLETDQEHAYLYDNDMQLAEISIPWVLEGLIPCTQLSVSPVGPVIGYVGGSDVSITASRQPNNCNQGVLYCVDDPEIISVSGLGVVSPISLGVANVSVMCGTAKKVVEFIIGQRYTNYTPHLAGRAIWYTNSVSGNMNIEQQNTDGRCNIILFTDSNIIIPDGYTLRVSLASQSFKILTCVYLLPEDGTFSFSGDTPHAEDVGVNWMRLNNCPAVIDPKSRGEKDGSVDYLGSFNRGEGTTWLNNTGKTAWLVISFESWDHDGHGNYTSRASTTSDYTSLATELTILVTPPSDS